jgi:hypothetical protein
MRPVKSGKARPSQSQYHIPKREPGTEQINHASTCEVFGVLKVWSLGLGLDSRLKASTKQAFSFDPAEYQWQGVIESNREGFIVSVVTAGTDDL